MEFDITSGEIIVTSCSKCPFNFERSGCFCDISSISSNAMSYSENKNELPLSCPLNIREIIIRAGVKS